MILSLSLCQTSAKEFFFTNCKHLLYYHPHHNSGKMERESSYSISLSLFLFLPLQEILLWKNSGLYFLLEMSPIYHMPGHAVGRPHVTCVSGRGRWCAVNQWDDHRLVRLHQSDIRAKLASPLDALWGCFCWASVAGLGVLIACELVTWSPLVV